MLLHPDDLPFDSTDTPDVFTAPLPTPAAVPPLPQGLDPGDVPSLADLGLEPIQRDGRAVVDHTGGETVGLARLHNYIWERNLLRRYKDSRNTMLGDDASSKFLAWLSRGCVSPRLIYQEVQRYERERVRNDSTYWLVFELLWRDFFRFVAVKHGTKLFKRTSLRGVDLP
jgi:deoxyribodipyrimidine photo-lyase